MTDQSVLASQVVIKIDGSEAQQQVMAKLSAVVVDQHTHLPHMFTLRFNDPNLELLDQGPFDLTKEVEILAEKTDGQRVSLIKGEITSLEPDFGEGMIAELLVRGYDKSHRLYRQTKSKAHLNIKDSDLAQQIASAAGLQAQVDATSTVYEHLYQHNQTDLELLFQRAWRIGYECFVSEGKLYFRKPPNSGEGLALRWGDDVLVFRPRMSLAEQVDEVVVKGWDPDKLSAIVGRASRGELYPQIGESKDGAQWAHTFGSGKLVVVDQPVESQAEADALAAARLDELSGAFIEADGIAYRRPDITAGKVVDIQALGQRFSGKYLVTNATHMYSPEGLRTMFTVRGSRTGLLMEQLGHGGIAANPQARWPGVVEAVVTNTDDPKKWGRVKLKFPWMAEDAESDWARLLGLGAGPEAGLFIVPDVGDEVLVTFLHGEFNQPVVLGGVWNGKHKIPPPGDLASQGQKPLVRTWHSRTGHKITVYDDAEKKIEIMTKDQRSITLSDKDRKIVLKTNGVEITLEDTEMKVKTDTKLTLQASSDVEIKANANMKLEANGNLDVRASGQVNIRGAMVNIN